MFWFRLAKELGMSVKQAQREIDSAEFNEWMAYYSLEPWGLEVQDASQAHIASILANVNRDDKKRAKPYTIRDFLIFSSAEKSESGPVLLADPDAQTEMMLTGMFGSMKNVVRAA